MQPGPKDRLSYISEQEIRYNKPIAFWSKDQKEPPYTAGNCQGDHERETWGYDDKELLENYQYIVCNTIIPKNLHMPIPEP